MPAVHYKPKDARNAACASSQPTSHRAITSDDWSKVTCKRCLTHKPSTPQRSNTMFYETLDELSSSLSIGDTMIVTWYSETVCAVTVIHADTARPTTYSKNRNGWYEDGMPIYKCPRCEWSGDEEDLEQRSHDSDGLTCCCPECGLDWDNF